MADRLKAFLDLIAYSEGTSTSPVTKNDGYDVVVSGVNGSAVFTDYAKHPFEDGGSVLVRRDPPLYSSAAGRYQLLARYWRVYKTQLKLPDYSPPSQDAVAIQQIKERRALALIEADDVTGAIAACASVWASFPGNDYGQGGRALPDLVAKYHELLTA